MKDLSECKILVVDDTEFNRELLFEILNDENHVSVACDGKTALEQIRNVHPDLILLDIMMPKMDGYELCQRLKAQEATRNIPIIFITALNDVKDEAAGLSLGAMAYTIYLGSYVFHPWK
jgi:putative two-component system response regulator